LNNHDSQSNLKKEAGTGVATRQVRRQKPRFLPPATKPMSEKSAAGDFFQ
jgi:hypothetical protein